MYAIVDRFLNCFRSGKKMVSLETKTRYPLYLCLLKKKAKDAAPTGARRKIRLFLPTFKGRLNNITPKKKGSTLNCVGKQTSKKTTI